MAHSFITFRDQTEMIKDRDIFVVVGLIRAHLQPGQTDARKIVDEWFFKYDEMPSGAIDLQLDRVLEDSTVRDDIVTGAKSALDAVVSFGETLPSEWLTRVLDDGDAALWKDRPTKDVRAIVERFLAVIAQDEA